MIYVVILNMTAAFCGCVGKEGRSVPEMRKYRFLGPKKLCINIRKCDPMHIYFHSIQTSLRYVKVFVFANNHNHSQERYYLS